MPAWSSRRLLALALAAAALAQAAVPHRHLGPEDFGQVETFVSRHSAGASTHWHRPVRIIHQDPCLACHWQRHLPLPAAGSLLPTPSLAIALVLVACEFASTVVVLDSPSRGPPALL
jgi:hypothetical protein